MFKKLISVAIAIVMVLSVSLALAKTIEPEEPEIERLAGRTVHATVGEYIDFLNAFRVTVYEDDRFDDDNIIGLKAGDILLVGGQPLTVKEMSTTPDEVAMAIMEDGSEIVFLDNGEGFGACSTDDDRIYMHAIAVLLLSPAEGIVYEDNSDPDLDAEMIVYKGLEDILAAKAVKEETSIGFDFYATTITLSDTLEIVKIHQNFDVAQ